MKRLALLPATLLLAALAAPTTVLAGHRFAVADDTIVVKMPNQARMTLVVKDREQLRQMQGYKLDSLMVLLDTYIAQAEAAGKSSKRDQVTMEFYPAQDQPGKRVPEQIRVTVRNQQRGGDHVEVRLGPNFGVQVDENKDGDSVKVHFGRTSSAKRDSLQKVRNEERANRAYRSGFSMDLGLNTLVNRQRQVNAQGQEVPYDLRPLGSRYISFQWRQSVRLGAKGSPLYLVTGPELAFNNYMFDNNRRLVNVESTSAIVPETSLSLQKSKLATTTLILPVMGQLYFRDKRGREAFRLAAGGFAGYRLSSHTKIKYDQDGSTKKDKDRDNFNLNDFNYGLQGVIGVRGLDLFVKYNLNELFKDNRGPGAQTLSFGISFL